MYGDITHRYCSMTASAHPHEEVSEPDTSLCGCVILKTLKIVPTAALFGADHIKVKVRAVITFSRLNLPGMD